MVMTGLARLVQVALLVLPAYNLLTALPGWRHAHSKAAHPRRHLRVVVPAHNEELAFPGLLSGIIGQDYPADLVSVWVIADRCTDRTAEIARELGVRASERNEGPDGKGAALAWYLERHPLQDGEALVVLDADNRVPPDLLSRFAAELGAGHQALQAYLDVTNPDESWLATASALQYWAANRMVQLARTNLGWTADLGGTGMCLTKESIEAVGGFGRSETEDQELTARLLLAGISVRWLHDVRVRDEKPAELAVAVKQRARWARGRREVARKYAGRLLRQGLRHRSAAHVDLAIRLVQPGRTFLAVISGLLALLAYSTRWRGFLPWQVWAGAAAVQVAAPLPFLMRERVPARYLWRYPLLAVFGLVWVPARFVARRLTGWYHTPHKGGASRHGGG